MPAESIGESCLLWRLGRGPTPANARRVHRLYRRLRDEAAAGRVAGLDVVPSYDSLAVHFDPLITDASSLQRSVEALLRDEKTDPPDQTEDDAPTHVFPVVYGGPDLLRVAQYTRVDEPEVIRRHTAPVYTVAAIGFLPHFPYLLGLDPSLTTPRLASPRAHVPAGAVAIGNDQAGVYPQDSPGGWNLIGTTDPGLLVALRPGDRVRFEVAT